LSGGGSLRRKAEVQPVAWWRPLQDHSQNAQPKTISGRMLAGSLEAFRVARPEAVGLERTKTGGAEEQGVDRSPRADAEHPHAQAPDARGDGRLNAGHPLWVESRSDRGIEGPDRGTSQPWPRPEGRAGPAGDGAAGGRIRWMGPRRSGGSDLSPARPSTADARGCQSLILLYFGHHRPVSAFHETDRTAISRRRRFPKIEEGAISYGGMGDGAGQHPSEG
jgi:hypothetical protein